MRLSTDEQALEKPSAARQRRARETAVAAPQAVRTAPRPALSRGVGGALGRQQKQVGALLERPRGRRCREPNGQE